MDQVQRQMVIATQAGFYRSQYVTRGQSFALISPSDFSSRWMVKTGAEAPDQIAAADPRRRSRPGERPASSVLTPIDAPTKGAKPAPSATPTGDQHVI